MPIIVQTNKLGKTIFGFISMNRYIYAHRVDEIIMPITIPKKIEENTTMNASYMNTLSPC